MAGSCRWPVFRSKVYAGEVANAAIDAGVGGEAWIVDALLGTGIAGEIDEPSRAVIARPQRRAGKGTRRRSALGSFIATAAKPLRNCVWADVTATFVAKSTGFAAHPAPRGVARRRARDRHRHPAAPARTCAAGPPDLEVGSVLFLDPGPRGFGVGEETAHGIRDWRRRGFRPAWAWARLLNALRFVEDDVHRLPLANLGGEGFRPMPHFSSRDRTRRWVFPLHGHQLDFDVEFRGDFDVLLGRGSCRERECSFRACSVVETARCRISFSRERMSCEV